MTRKTRDIADRIVADGESPLEVMLRAMRQHAAAGNLDRAAEIARYAAPFCHARISSITLETPDLRPPAGELDVEIRAAEAHSAEMLAYHRLLNGHVPESEWPERFRLAPPA